MAWLSNWAPEPTNPWTKITGLRGDRGSWAAAAVVPATVADKSVTIAKIAPRSLRIMVLSPLLSTMTAHQARRLSRALMTDSGRDGRWCQASRGSTWAPSGPDEWRVDGVS